MGACVRSGERDPRTGWCVHLEPDPESSAGQDKIERRTR
jgi:hypothetical protein